MSKVAPVPGAGRITKKSSDCNQEDSKQGSEAPPEGRGSSVLYASNRLSEGVTILSLTFTSNSVGILRGDLAAIRAIR